MNGDPLSVRAAEKPAQPMAQPRPTPNDSTPIVELVISDLQERARVGLAKYGTKLQAGNGRDALQDAYEEALDLAQYLRQAIEERKFLGDDPARVGERALVPTQRKVEPVKLLDRCQHEDCQDAASWIVVPANERDPHIPGVLTCAAHIECGLGVRIGMPDPDHWIVYALANGDRESGPVDAGKVVISTFRPSITPAVTIVRPTCAVCNDTHRMEMRGREVMCTHCPRPCNLCRNGIGGAYCAKTPCSCVCHAATSGSGQ